MNRYFVAAVLAYGVVVSAYAAPVQDQKPRGSSGFQAVVRDLRAGRNMAAAKAARRLIEQGASTPAPRAVMGLALGRQGLFADALPHLEATEGTLPYVRLGGTAVHADSLRAAGRGAEAWMVRKTGLDWGGTGPHLVQTLAAGVEDLISVLALNEAFGLAEKALVIAPGSSTAHAVMSRVHLMKGELSQAEFHHWLSRRYASHRTARIYANQAGIAEVYGDIDGAAAAWRMARKRKGKDVHLTALYVGWLRRVGRLGQARTILKERRWRTKQSAELCIEAIRVGMAEGDVRAAQLAWERMANLFPEHPLTQSLKVQIDG